MEYLVWRPRYKPEKKMQRPQNPKSHVKHETQTYQIDERSLFLPTHQQAGLIPPNFPGMTQSRSLSTTSAAPSSLRTIPCCATGRFIQSLEWITRWLDLKMNLDNFASESAKQKPRSESFSKWFKSTWRHQPSHHLGWRERSMGGYLRQDWRSFSSPPLKKAPQNRAPDKFHWWG
jgi:hypothetical protein